MLDDCTVTPIPPEQFCAKYSAVMYVYRKSNSRLSMWLSSFSKLIDSLQFSLPKILHQRNHFSC